MRNQILSISMSVSAIIASVAISGCSNKPSAASTVTLTLPDFSKTDSTHAAQKDGVSTMSGGTKSYISRVMLNVRGNDIPNPIFFVAQSHDLNRPVPSTIQVLVPSGSSRLIQALLVVKTVDTDSNGGELTERSEKFFYGDVVKSLSGDDSVDLDVTNVATTGGADGAIAGRLIDVATSNGPTGHVDVQFAPPNGSPMMTVMETEIHGGWFNFMAFENLPFKYVMRDGRVLIPDQKIGVEPVSPGTKLGYVIVPPYFKIAKDGNTEVDRFQVQGRKYLLGYFGDGAPDANRFCYDASGSANLNNAYTSATPNDPAKVQWAGTGLPTALLAGVKAGGQPAAGASCGGADYLTDLHINTAELTSHDRFVDFFGPFRSFTASDTTKKILDVYLSASHVNVAWAFLPGAVGPARVSSVSIFTRTLAAAPSNHGDPDYMQDGNVQCDRLTDPKFLSQPFTFQTAVQASQTPVNSVDLGAISTAADISSGKFQVVACPINDFGLHKFTSAISSYSSGSGNAVQSSEELRVVAPVTNIYAAACQAFTLTHYANGVPTNASSPITVTLSNNGLGQLFNDSSCGGSGSVTIATGTSSAQFSIRSSMPGLVRVSAMAPNMTGANLAVAVGTISPLQMISTVLQETHLVQNYCYPVNLLLTGADGISFMTNMNIAASLSSTSVGVFFSDPACTVGNEYSLSAGNINFASNEFFKTVYFKPTALTAGAALQAIYGATPTNGSQAYDVAAEVLSNFDVVHVVGWQSPTKYYLPNDCFQVQARAVASNGGVLKVTADTVRTLSRGPSSFSFSTDACSTLTSSLPMTISQGQNASPMFYIKDPGISAISVFFDNVSTNAPLVRNAANVVAKNAIGQSAMHWHACERIDISLLDSFSVPLNAVEPTSVHIADSSTDDTQLFSDSSCASLLLLPTDRSIPRGSSLTSVWMKMGAAPPVLQINTPLQITPTPSNFTEHHMAMGLVNAASPNTCVGLKLTSSVSQQMAEPISIQITSVNGTGISNLVSNINSNYLYTNSSCTTAAAAPFVITVAASQSSTSIPTYWIKTAPTLTSSMFTFNYQGFGIDSSYVLNTNVNCTSGISCN